MKDLLNPHILQLRPYQAGKPIEEVFREYRPEKVVKLASNENPFPIPAHVVEAIKKEIPSLTLYPDNDSYQLRKRIAEYNGVGIANVIVGCGSAEIIRMTLKAFLKPGEQVMTGVSTFGLFKTAAIENGGREALVEVAMDEGYGFDLDKMYLGINAKTKVIIIANPNNPTGTIVGKQKLLDFIEKIPEQVILILDNAYQEYVTRKEEHVDGISQAISRKNIIVLRTFSKVYGLAGLRVGYGISNEEMIGYLNRVKTPFNVNRIANQAALASLENDDFKTASALKNEKNREWLFNQIKGMGLRVIPSEANFLLFFPGVDPLAMNERLLKEGVIIRPLQAFGVPDGIRVTVGAEEENAYFIEKLIKVLKSFP